MYIIEKVVTSTVDVIVVMDVCLRLLIPDYITLT